MRFAVVVLHDIDSGVLVLRWWFWGFWFGGFGVLVVGVGVCLGGVCGWL